MPKQTGPCRRTDRQTYRKTARYQLDKPKSQSYFIFLVFCSDKFRLVSAIAPLILTTYLRYGAPNHILYLAAEEGRLIGRSVGRSVLRRIEVPTASHVACNATDLLRYGMAWFEVVSWQLQLRWHLHFQQKDFIEKLGSVELDRKLDNVASWCWATDSTNKHKQAGRQMEGRTDRQKPGKTSSVPKYITFACVCVYVCNIRVLLFLVASITTQMSPVPGNRLIKLEMNALLNLSACVLV